MLTLVLLAGSRIRTQRRRPPCALRLLTRMFEQHPRAFDVICGDNPYMNPNLWKRVRSHNKHIIAVLKNEDRDLLVDARSLFTPIAPITLDDNKVRRACWDLNGFTTWPQCGEPVRGVRSVKHTTIKPQKDRKEKTVVSEWFWVTSPPPFLASTQTIVRAGHGRCGIENHGFNEFGNQWHGDHAYKYNAHALLACALLLFIAYNLFRAYIERNLKAQARAERSQKHWADLIAAEFATTFHPYATPHNHAHASIAFLPPTDRPPARPVLLSPNPDSAFSRPLFTAQSHARPPNKRHANLPHPRSRPRTNKTNHLDAQRRNRCFPPCDVETL